MSTRPERVLLLLIKPITLVAITCTVALAFIFGLQSAPLPPSKPFMARSFILWLHGLGDSGPANAPIKTFFSAPEFSNTKWSFPSAPSMNVSCNYGALMPSWFDIYEIPIAATIIMLFRLRQLQSFTNKPSIWRWTITSFARSYSLESPKDEKGVMKAVQNVHEMIDKEVAAGTSPENIFICGFSQGGALTLASVLLYPRALGGGAVFSGWVPFNPSIIEQITPDAKKTPILWSHGMADRTVLFEAGQAGPLFLEQAGINCEFKAYPDLGHSLSNDELQSLESWIKTRLQSSS